MLKCLYEPPCLITSFFPCDWIVSPVWNWVRSWHN